MKLVQSTKTRLVFQLGHREERLLLRVLILLKNLVRLFDPSEGRRRR